MCLVVLECFLKGLPRLADLFGEQQAQAQDVVRLGLLFPESLLLAELGEEIDVIPTLYALRCRGNEVSDRPLNESDDEKHGEQSD